MGLFDLLSFSSSSSSVTSNSGTIITPTFDQNKDSINLQIKSLLYLFKRLRINKLSTLPNKDGSLRYNDSQIELLSDNPTYEKLDKIYCLDKFMKILINDEYRILVDFIKNKFRSMCMIHEYPNNLSRPSSPIKGQSSSSLGIIKFPDFHDYKERNMIGKNFKFILFPLNDINMDKLIMILIESDIYIEHNVSYSKRYLFAIESINQIINNNNNNNKNSINLKISIDEKNQIIRNYLIKMAIYVQLSRIYQEYTKLHPLVIGATPSLGSSVSPIKKPITLRKSMSNLTLNKSSSTPSTPSSSPTKLAYKKSMNKLNSKPSIPRFKLDELYNPVTSPPRKSPGIIKSESETTTTTTSSNDDVDDELINLDCQLDKENLRIDVYEKCKLAIIEKLNHEKLKICTK